MNLWADNKLKISGELINVLAKHYYAYRDPKTGQPVLYLTRLQKTESIQSVAAWFRDKSMADLLLGELRQQLEVNGLPPLRDHANTADEEKRTQGFWEFGRKIAPAVLMALILSGCANLNTHVLGNALVQGTKSYNEARANHPKSYTATDRYGYDLGKVREDY